MKYLAFGTLALLRSCPNPYEYCQVAGVPPASGGLTPMFLAGVLSGILLGAIGALVAQDFSKRKRR